MTNKVRISGLADADESVAAEVPAVQGGATKRFELRSAASKAAGTAAGEVPVLATNGVLATAQGGTGLNLADNAAQPSRYFGRDASGVLGLHSLPSGGGGGGGATDIAWSQTAAGARADEEDILDGTETADTKFVGNKTLRDVITDVDNSVDWGAWTSTNIRDFNTPLQVSFAVPSGYLFPIYGFNASTYNAQTQFIPAGGIAIFTTECSGLPILSSGTRRGFLVAVNDAGERWAITIANPEGSDAEATWQFMGGDAGWVARGYRGNELRTSYAGLYSNNTWEIFSSLARGGPTANEFDDEVCFAKRDSRRRYIVRAVFDTANNPDRLRVMGSTSDYAFDIADREITAAKLGDAAVITRTIASEAVDNSKMKSGTIQTSRMAASNSPATGKFVKVDDSDATKIKFVDAPSGGGYTETTLVQGSISPSSTTTYQISGQQWADYDAFYVRLKASSGLAAQTCWSPVLPILAENSCAIPYGMYIRVFDNAGVARYVFHGDNSDRRLTRIIGISYG